MNLIEFIRHLNANMVKGRYPEETELPWESYQRIFNDIRSQPNYTGTFWVDRDSFMDDPDFPPPTMMVKGVLVRPKIVERVIIS